MSQGQKQLLGLARALLLNRPLLLLDEANASVDEATEAIMDTAIRAFLEGRMFFQGATQSRGRRTLLAVVHRLKGVMALDQVNFHDIVINGSIY